MGSGPCRLPEAMAGTAGPATGAARGVDRGTTGSIGYFDQGSDRRAVKGFGSRVGYAMEMRRGTNEVEERFAC